LVTRVESREHDRRAWVDSPDADRRALITKVFADIRKAMSGAMRGRYRRPKRATLTDLAEDGSVRLPTNN